MPHMAVVPLDRVEEVGNLSMIYSVLMYMYI